MELSRVHSTPGYPANVVGWDAGYVEVRFPAIENLFETPCSIFDS